MLRLTRTTLCLTWSLATSWSARPTASGTTSGTTSFWPSCGGRAGSLRTRWRGRWWRRRSGVRQTEGETTLWPPSLAGKGSPPLPHSAMMRPPWWDACVRAAGEAGRSEPRERRDRLMSRWHTLALTHTGASAHLAPATWPLGHGSCVTAKCITSLTVAPASLSSSTCPSSPSRHVLLLSPVVLAVLAQSFHMSSSMYLEPVSTTVSFSRSRLFVIWSCFWSLAFSSSRVDGIHSAASFRRSSSSVRSSERSRVFLGAAASNSADLSSPSSFRLYARRSSSSVCEIFFSRVIRKRPRIAVGNSGE
mmetsp:Transcript_5767/g.11067  ORF Transcript_5767/g.11067 Transcript_5767/m.11067 type:complete len:305 (+) Transcript_5767:276-1190(+)